MDNKSTTKRMIGAVVLVLIAALLLAWLLKGKNKSVQEQQELIADQTQEASPILGFPGVNDDDKNADGQLAQDGDGAATEDGSYVIGAADQATDNAQQQAQDALAAGGDAAASAGGTAANGAGQVAALAAGAAAGAATAASQAGQQVADNATGFQVRDPQNQDGAEQRPIVENGEVKTGTGSMGGNEVATGTQDQQSGGDATQAAAATGGAAATQSSGDSSGSGSGSAAQRTASSGSSGSSAKPAKKRVANPKLVNEKPVPSPRTQSASAGNRSSGSSTSRSARSSSASSRASDSATAAGGNGYAIQVLAASSRSKAEGVRQDIARDGYPAFVVRAKVNGKTVYRVRVGTYPGKGTARAVQSKMKARYTKNRYVQNSFVTKN